MLPIVWLMQNGCTADMLDADGDVVKASAYCLISNRSVVAVTIRPKTQWKRGISDWLLDFSTPPEFLSPNPHQVFLVASVHSL